MGLAVLLAYLSIPVVQNLFSSRQLMNTSFDSLRILNTYGAFGRSVNSSSAPKFCDIIIETCSFDYQWYLGKLFFPQFSVFSAFVSCVYSVTKERTEVVLEGTYNSSLGRAGERAEWKEIEFKCKPGTTDRRPCLISPYHYRLDWLMWFAAFQVLTIYLSLHCTITT